MLFDIKLEEVVQSNVRNVIRQLQSHRFYIVLAFASLFLTLYTSLLIGSFFFLLSCSAYYVFSLYIEVSSITFGTDGIDFGLQDVINDLERR